MLPTIINEAAPVPPAYHRVQARLGPALHIDALTLVNTVHLLTLCRLAVRLAAHQAGRPDLIRSRHSRARAYVGGLLNDDMLSRNLSEQ